MELTGGGFEPARTVLHLTFDAPDLAGLDVRMYVPPLAEFRRLSGLAATIKDGGEEAIVLFDTLAAYMKSWNVTSGGVPVPTTPEGLGTQEVPFLARILRAWMSAMADVPDPLAPSSPPGLPDLPDIPMTPAPSLPS